jgi:1-acyl-sn-glycerol-3-phosphate acyltransferase
MTKARLNPYYWSWHYALRGIVPALAHARVRGRQLVPRRGPFLLVANHLSMADPVALIAYTPRHIHWITKAEVFEQWPLSIILPPGDPIKVNRARADRQALRQAEEYLRNGEPVGIFAEGTRSRGGEAQEARAGVVFLAQRTEAPILPVAISGTEKLFPSRFPWYQRARIEITFGEPFQLSELGEVTRANRDRIAQRVMGRVAALLPPAYRGVYAEALVAPLAPSPAAEPPQAEAVQQNATPGDPGATSAARGE